METDKLISTTTIDGVTIKQIVFRVHRLTYHHEKSSVTSRLNGGAERTEIIDITLNILVQAFGPTRASG